MDRSTLGRRDRFDLDEEVWPVQLRNFDQSDSRRGRWSHSREKAIARLAVSCEVAHVAKEYGQLHEIARRAADRLQSRPQIEEHLGGLRRKIVLSDQSAVPIEGGLACYYDETTCANLHDLRIAGRRAEFGRIDAPNRGCLSAH